MGRFGASLLCLLAALVGCAADVQRTAVTFTPARAETERRVIRVRAPVTVTLDTGYTRIIKKDSAWRYVGTTPAGAVFQPLDDVFAIVGANMHEAYLVIAAGQLVGFYLPGEGAFSALSNPVRLITE